jgi:Zn-dependent protease
MASAQSGSFRFFRVSGIQVYVHWSWFIVAWIELSTRRHAYGSWIWNVAEYLGLFLIVLLHEFGHAFACRQVGGVAHEIVLWPLGGVAFARPPQRPGAELWTIAAGPLVNVALWPLLMVATWACGAVRLSDHLPDLEKLLFTLWVINRGLLFFNVLPIFPLDGGQILRSLLWFPMGRARSLHLAAAIGLAGIVGLGAYALWRRPDAVLWIAVFAVFLGSQCIAGLRQARALLALETLPRRSGFACPRCHTAPPAVPAWACAQCGNRFDAFVTDGVCPHCRSATMVVSCVDCGAENALARWHTKPRPMQPGDAPVIDV